jgi:hypothetical protein
MSSGRSLPCAPRPTHTGILTALYAVNASGGPVEGCPASRRQTTCPGGVSSWALVIRHSALAPRKWLPGAISTTSRQPSLARGFHAHFALDGNRPGVHESTREASGAILPLASRVLSPGAGRRTGGAMPGKDGQPAHWPFGLHQALLVNGPGAVDSALRRPRVPPGR